MDDTTRENARVACGNKGHVIQPTAEDETTLVSVLEDGALDPVYEAKAKVLNREVQQIGMGRYQWQVSIHFSSSCHSLHIFLLVWSSW
jgi:hypothetical protein